MIDVSLRWRRCCVVFLFVCFLHLHVSRSALMHVETVVFEGDILLRCEIATCNMPECRKPEVMVIVFLTVLTKDSVILPVSVNDAHVVRPFVHIFRFCSRVTCVSDCWGCQLCAVALFPLLDA